MKRFILLALVSIFAFSLYAANNTVTLWSWRMQDAPVWEKVEQELKKQGIDVNIEYSVYDPTQYDSKVNLALQTGTGPDLVYSRRLPGGRTQSLIDAGLYLPLNEYISLDNFPQASVNAVTSNSKIYGVPFAVQVVGIFYNKKIYDKYNLSEPKTWDELIKNAETLQKNGVTPFFVPGKDGWALAMQHAIAGVSLLQPEWIKDLIDGKTNFLDPKWIEVNKKLNDLKVFYQKGFSGNSTQDLESNFAFEQAAMVFYGSWGYQLYKTLNPDIQVGYFMAPPSSTNEKPYAYTYVDGGIALTSNTKNKELAIEVLKFVSTPEFGTILSNTTFDIPAVSGATLPDDPLFKELVETYNNHASPYVYWVGSPFVTGKPSLYDDILTPGMQEMYAGRITPEELAKKCQEGISMWYEPLMK